MERNRSGLFLNAQPRLSAMRLENAVRTPHRSEQLALREHLPFRVQFYDIHPRHTQQSEGRPIPRPGER